MNATVIRADARDLPLADGSVDLIAASIVALAAMLLPAFWNAAPGP